MSREKFILTEQDVDKFDELFSKDLSNEEYAKLQLLMDTDEVFKYKLILYRKLTQEISQEAESNEKLKSRFKKIDIKAKNKHKLAWLRLAIAACLLIIVGFGYRYIYNTKGKSEIVYEAYKNSEPGLPIRMANNNVTLFDSAMIAFKKDDFGAAISLLNRSEVSDTTIYFIGVCNEMSGADNDAIIAYQTISNSSSAYIANKAKYRLMLVFLKREDIRYRKLLEEISKDNNSPYQSSAIKIRSMLGKS